MRGITKKRLACVGLVAMAALVMWMVQPEPYCDVWVKDGFAWGFDGWRCATPAEKAAAIARYAK